MILTRRSLIAGPLLFLAALSGPVRAAPANKALDAQFLAAAQNGNLLAVKRLLSRGANVNAKDADGFTALLNAIRPSYEGGDNLPLIRLLIAHRANVNAANGTGQTPLMSAASVGNLNLAKLLLAKGARVNAEDKNGQTPLMYAAGGASTETGEDRSSPAIVKLLLAKGARVNATDAYGQTPLIVAARCSTGSKAGDAAVTETGRLLLAHGASLQNKTASGFTALKWVKVRGHHTLEKLIAAKLKSAPAKAKPVKPGKAAPKDPHAHHPMH